MARPTFNSNQFNQAHAIGDLDLQSNPNPQILTARLNPSSSNTVGSVAGVEAGQAVKLVDLSTSDVAGGQVPVVDVGAALTDALLGVVVNGTKQGIVPPGQTLQVAGQGAVIWMAADGALNRGVAVLFDTAKPGYVQATTAKTGKVLGVTLDKATAADQLIRVQLIVNGTAYTGSVSS